MPAFQLSIKWQLAHTTKNSFMKYIKVTKEQQADRMAQHPFFY